MATFRPFSRGTAITISDRTASLLAGHGKPPDDALVARAARLAHTHAY